MNDTQLTVSAESGYVQPSKPKSYLPRLRMAVIGFVILGLTLLNIATLVEERIHSRGFDLLKSLIAPALAQATLERLLSQSPTQKKQALEKSHQSAIEQHSKLQKLSTKRAEIAGIVSKRIGRRAIANAMKNFSSLAAEILPGIGVPVIIALTVSDLYDDCQTLKDLNELNAQFEFEREDTATVCGLKVP